MLLRRRKSEKSNGITAISTHPQKRVWNGGYACMPYQECQPSSRENMLVTAAMAETANKNAAHNAVFCSDEESEIEDGPDEKESADVNFLADVILRGVAPLTNEPCGKEQQSQCLLGLVAQQHPTEAAQQWPT